MIIKSKHHFLVYPLYRIYTLIKIRLNFHKVEIAGEFRDKNLPLLLIANHISWWDGIWIMYLNIKRLNRKFNVMMLEHQIKNYRITGMVGAYSVKKRSRTIIETLNYTSELLSDNRNMVLMFPQGEIQSVYKGQIKFEKGIERIIKENRDKIQVLLIANLIDYFSCEKPTLFIYLKELETKEFTLEAIENEYNSFYSGSISQNIHKSDNQ
jgi:1-acyl-sn-glycerol-3-phosphate acyltransferase